MGDENFNVWKQFHNPKDLALSICLEAAELLGFSAMEKSIRSIR